MQTRPARFLLLVLLLLVPFASPPAALAVDRGLAIARAADAYDEGFSDYTADLTMELRDRRGGSTRRSLRIRVLETPGDGDRSLFIFDSPADVRGTLMLTHSHGSRSDDQWLYLPAIKRVKRIASRNKSGPFVGSEFAYEDLGSQEPEKYDYRWLRDEGCGAWQCDVLERRPRNRASGYRRQVVWIDRDRYRVVKVEFYDRRDELLKTLTFSGYREYIGHYWRPARMRMQNHQTGKSTQLDLRNYRFGTGLRAADFEPGALARVR